jgi:hypothetical protein
MSVGVGHGTEFVQNFAFLLTEAVEQGIYIKEHYSQNPVNYCGMQIANEVI